MEDKILLYSQLAPAERAEIEAYVADHPHLRPMLDEARALGTLFEEARLLHADPPGDEALAYYLATHHIDARPAPPALAAVFSKIEARLQTDNALRTRYDALARRMADLEADSNTASHFERVTGLYLEPAPRAQATPPSPQPVGRGPVHRRISKRGWATIALGTVMALYLGLFAFSHLTVPPIDDIAAFEEEDLQGFGSALRSASPDNDARATLDRYEDALALLREVRIFTLGLFPRFDTQALQTAASLLEQVIAHEADGSVLQMEAYYLLAKTRLAQHDVPAARAALQPVLERDNIRTPYAKALREEIEALGE